MNKFDLIENLENPQQLELLYRNNKVTFKSEFNLIYPELTNNKIADYWHERLKYDSVETSWGSKNELIFVIVASCIAGVIAKFPTIFNIDPELFYTRNIGLIIFPVLSFYFIWKKNHALKKMAIIGIAFLLASIFINSLPIDAKSDTLLLSCIHLPLFLWAVLGFSYVKEPIKDFANRLEFLRYNGDLLIMTGLILIAGFMLTAITIGLFSVIGFKIEKIYFDYFGIFGLAAAPILGTFITQTNPQLVNKVSPVIAKIFSPLVLIMLIVYLIAIFYSGKDPYKDREFLMVFNILLIGVMAIILFSVAETLKKSESKLNSIVLFALSSVTIMVNGIALSAILFRISTWGITPNRLAVLGGNILILSNLVLVTFHLFNTIFKKSDISLVENSISKFLPIYIIWTMIVTFLFPLLFHFK